MAQTYKMMLGTSGKQWELLTVESDGRMTMTFHGTDREICHEVTENEDGWLCYPGAMFPGLASGRWQAVAAQMRNENSTLVALTSVKELEMRNENEEMNNEARAEPYRGQAPCNPPSATHTGDSPREPRPRRQRKPRKPRTNNREPLTVNREPLTVNHQPSATLKAVGMVAAATVALLVIYETGLLIPLGLIGLATSGLLK